MSVYIMRRQIVFIPFLYWKRTGSVSSSFSDWRRNAAVALELPEKQGL